MTPGTGIVLNGGADRGRGVLRYRMRPSSSATAGSNQPEVEQEYRSRAAFAFDVLGQDGHARLRSTVTSISAPTPQHAPPTISGRRRRSSRSRRCTCAGNARIALDRARAG
ncbi:MAG: hypothetical protein R2849_00030 [Thermomicrobiales bacterium]